MSDELLLVLGCAITFIALAGAYIALRAGFAHGFPRSERAKGRARDVASPPSRAAARPDAAP